SLRRSRQAELRRGVHRSRNRCGLPHQYRARRRELPVLSRTYLAFQKTPGLRSGGFSFWNFTGHPPREHATDGTTTAGPELKARSGDGVFTPVRKIRKSKFKTRCVMKKLLLVGAAMIALGTASASAADIQRRQMPAKAPAYMPPPVYNWTGFYVGINGGGGWGRSDFSDPFASG